MVFKETWISNAYYFFFFERRRRTGLYAKKKLYGFLFLAHILKTLLQPISEILDTLNTA